MFWYLNERNSNWFFGLGPRGVLFNVTSPQDSVWKDVSLSFSSVRKVVKGKVEGGPEAQASQADSFREKYIWKLKIWKLILLKLSVLRTFLASPYPQVRGALVCEDHSGLLQWPPLAGTQPQATEFTFYATSLLQNLKSFLLAWCLRLSHLSQPMCRFSVLTNFPSSPN